MLAFLTSQIDPLPFNPDEALAVISTQKKGCTYKVTPKDILAENLR